VTATSTSPRFGHSGAESDADVISFTSRMNVLLRARWLLLICALLGVLGAIIRAYVLDRQYTSRAVILPQARRAQSALSGLASSLNLSLPSVDASQSPSFYADLLLSRQLLGMACDARFNFQDAGQLHSATLSQILGARGANSALKREDAIDRLSERISANVIAKTGVIRLAVTLPNPSVAQRTEQRLIELLDQFNRETRKSQAAAERQFTEQRLSEVTAEMRRAEDRLQSFLQQNRQFTNSPELAFERERLTNDLSLRRELYSTVAKAYEQARVEEVRDTPVTTIIETPSLPIRPDPRGLLKKAVAGIAFGVVIGIIIAFFRRASSEPTDEDPLVEFQHLKRALFQELRHPLAALKARFGQSRRPHPF
jgi:uncharacterized protein involved in exopolysaccharide biosynthesis